MTVAFSGAEVSVTGNLCPKGKAYAVDECTCPKRVLTTTVAVKGGGVLPVKTDKPIEKRLQFEVMKEINRHTVTLPVEIGQIVFALSGEVNVVATAARA
ncbi:MAG: DUF1667 domain-containing protein [Clostridiales bacterium]|jgi:CxxC motif-containing protein|nr:DUF1667 domain-containing protein [Clostridiales bacterium]